MTTDYRNLTLTLYQKLMFRVSAVAAGLAIGWMFYDSLAAGAAVGIVLCFGESKYKEILAEKRKRELLVQFKDMLYSVSTAVSTGRSLGQALEESIDFWRGTYDDEDYMIKELRGMVRKMRESNWTDTEVLKEFADRSGLEDAADFVTVCRTCKATGADFRRAVDRGAEIIGDKIAIERELKTIMAQKKFEGRVVALAPFGLMLMIKILSPAYMAPLYAVPVGKAVSTISLALIAAGFMAVERVNQIEI